MGPQRPTPLSREPVKERPRTLGLWLGGEYRTRTGNLLVANQALSQLS